MTSTEKIRTIIMRRETTNDEWQAGVEKCWNELVDALTEDIEVTRKFLLEDCTADEASWVSEVYDDIARKTQSKEYIDVLRKSIERFPKEAEKHHMAEILDTAVKSVLGD
jgi:hypothetical protein